METWEYAVAYLSFDSHADPSAPERWSDGKQKARDMATLLNLRGQQGWELVTVTTAGVSSGKDYYTCYFKRRKP